jgi:hypothetical protein
MIMDTCQTIIAAPTVVTEDPIDAQLTTEHTQIVEDLEDLASADLALESYRGLLDAAAKNGITRQSAMALKIGLQRIDRKLGIKSVALENMNIGPRDRFQISLEDEQKLIGERKDSLVEKGKELIKKLIAKAKELFERAKQLVMGIPAKVDRAKALLKHWKATAGLKIELDAEGQRYLMKDGKPLTATDVATYVNFVGQALTAVTANAGKAISNQDLGELPAYNGPLPSSVEITVNPTGYGITSKGEAEGVAHVKIREAAVVDKELNALRSIGQELADLSGKMYSQVDKLNAVTTSESSHEQKITGAINQLISIHGLLRLANEMVASQVVLVHAEANVFSKPEQKAE